MLKQLIVIFNLNLYHRSVTKKKKNRGIHVFLDCEDYTCNLSCIDFEQNFCIFLLIGRINLLIRAAQYRSFVICFD